MASDILSDSLDPWAWASVEHESDAVDVSALHVTAVLVAHNAADWLAETLEGIRDLRRRPARLIAIDHDSDDTTLDLLDAACDDGVLDAVYTGPYDAGFGDGIREALGADAEVHARPADGWLWLLHDDAVPAPDVLEQLLVTVVNDPEVAVTGPKLLRPRQLRRPPELSELGVSISGTGRREIFIDHNEIDQGQRDEATERLAVSSCGMLVSARVWSELGGFDPAIPVFRDGTEFGWRARLGGHRVLTSPYAVMVHRQVGRAGLRLGGAAGWRPHATDRALGLALVVGHSPTPLVPLVYVRLLFGCLVRAIGYVLGKVPRRAADELIAGWWLLRHPGRVTSIRSRVADVGADPEQRRKVAALRPPWWSSWRVGLETVSAAIANRYTSIAGDLDSATLDELTGDDFAARGEEKQSNPWFSPIVLTIGLSVVLSLVAARRLLRDGSLTASSLLPAPTFTGLWEAFLAPVAGADQVAGAPWLGLLAVGSTILGGRPEWLVTVLLLGTVPLALLSVYPVVRTTIGDRRVRLWVAVSYALLPVLLGSTNQGRLALATAAVVLPLIALAGRALVLRRPGNPEAWRGGWGAGLVLVVLVAFQPLLMVLAVVVGLIAVLTVARTPRKAGRVGIALGVPLLVLAPWWPTVVQGWSLRSWSAGAWGRALTGPDAALDGVTAAPDVVLLLLGRVGGGGLPPLWIGALVFGATWLVALVGLRRAHRNPAVRAGWLVAIGALALAVLSSRLVVSVPPYGAEVRPWTGVLMLVAFGGLLVAGGIGVDGLTSELRLQSFTLLQPGTVVLAAAVVVVSLLGAGWWVVGGATGSVERTTATAIPPYVQNAQTGPDQVRTLAIDLTNTATGGPAAYSVVQGPGVRLGDAERGFAYGSSEVARAQTADLVGRIVAGTADDGIEPELISHGIGYLWVRGASDEQRARIDNTPGLGTASGTEGDVVWKLEAPVSRAMIVTAGDATTVSLTGPTPVGSSTFTRTLRLADPVDARWHATLNGIPLDRVDTAAGNDWQQSFALPQDGGVLAIRLEGRSPLWPIGQGLVLLVIAVLAAPAIRRPEVLS
ncbi:MAG: glycosyltransferase [Propionibacteriaceae bacterium]